MYKLIRKSNLPKFLKVLFYIVLTLTCVYWLGYLIYKFLDIFRAFLNYISRKEHWWAFIICFAILAIGTFLVAELVFKLGWWNSLLENLNGAINNLRTWLDETLHKIIAPK